MNSKAKEGAKTPKKFFYSVKEFAKILEVSSSSIYTRIESKEFPCKRVGRRVLIPAKFVEDYIAAVA
ncbi:MAG: helix-turn-helix domain-containing protein [Anaerovibrio sp.]|nr:helix-turn-helix domain-containing protein [Anaerovibrio sp.]